MLYFPQRCPGSTVGSASRPNKLQLEVLVLIAAAIQYSGSDSLRSAHRKDSLTAPNDVLPYAPIKSDPTHESNLSKPFPDAHFFRCTALPVYPQQARGLIEDRLR